jgi:glutamate racemase
VNSAPIGIFDSGLGGLTVAHAIFERLPADSTIYFGDTARVPYGPKSADTVRRYSREIMAWLLGEGVKAIVIACNTSTAHALETLQELSPVPVIGVIEPGARAAVEAAGDRPIGVIGTAGTIASGAYERAIHRIAPGSPVLAAACPLFVPLVEEGWFDHPATRLAAEEYLAPLRAGAIGALVLGCTHYPLLAPLIQDIMGPSVTLVDGGAETARRLAEVLAERNLEAPVVKAAGGVAHRFAVSDDPGRFAAVGARFLGERLTGAEVVTLDSA